MGHDTRLQHAQHNCKGQSSRVSGRRLAARGRKWTHLVLLARALAVLGQGLQGLRDQVHVGLVDVEAQQAQTPRGGSTHDVQKLQRLTHQVVVGLVVLAAQEVLQSEDPLSESLLSALKH